MISHSPTQHELILFDPFLSRVFCQILYRKRSFITFFLQVSVCLFVLKVEDYNRINYCKFTKILNRKVPPVNSNVSVLQNLVATKYKNNYGWKSHVKKGKMWKTILKDLHTMTEQWLKCHTFQYIYPQGMSTCGIPFIELSKYLVYFVWWRYPILRSPPSSKRTLK